ncbi:MAG TPA: GNAT family N-acetyltransferase [Chitinophagaceae bacterium]
MIIKTATEPDEFLQIHELNYKTFVEEIPQHHQNIEKRLVDKFHERNKYIIAKKDGKVIGMVCYISQRPFSIEGKLDNFDSYLPNYSKLAEIRLLSVCAEERKTTIAYRLLQHLCRELIEIGADAAVISGTTRQLRLYTRMGFTAFGPLVGTGDALYQPMYITLKDLRNDFRNS